MRAKLTRISVRRSGNVARRTDVLESDPIRIGRAVGNEIVLEGLSVSLHHADLDHRGDGVYLVPRSSAPILRNGRRVDGDVRLAGSDALGIGPYTLRVTEIGTDDIDLALELEGSASVPDVASIAPPDRRRLEQGGRTRWSYAWIAAGVTLVLALVWPLASGRQASWSTGPISNAHAPIAVECSACHQPFRRVANTLCLECHANLGSHVGSAPALSEIDELRCASCHLEHGGADGLAALEDATCAGCHLDPRRFDSDLSRASDFAAHHPEFTLHVLVPGEEEGEASTVQRTAWSPSAQEHSGLAFNHLAHVGGVMQNDGTRANLRCDACHVPDEGGRRMAPISFEEHCRSCHTLNFSLGGRGEGRGDARGRTRQAQAPHGEPGELRRQLRRVFLDDALPPRAAEAPGERDGRLEFLRRPGARRTSEEQALLDAVDRRVETAFTQLMSDEYCGECHTLVPEDLPDAVAPVALTRAWLGPTRFDHTSHAATACARCHPRAAVHSEEYEAQAADFDRDAATLPGAIPFGLESAESLRERGFAPSERAEDVLVLGRESCRECHGGSRATPPEVASGCVMCHPYHHPSREPIGGGVAGAHASLEGQGLGFAR